MRLLLTQLGERLEQINLLIGNLISWLVALMVLAVFAVVVMRYGFQFGNIAFQEVSTYLHSLAFMLAMAYTLAHNEHVRVDIFYRNLSSRKQALIDLVGTALLLIPFCIFVIVFSWNYVTSSWALLESSREAGGLPFVYLLKSAIPLMAVLLLLQGSSVILKSISTLLSRPS